jgi:hypothetical protein
MKKIIILFVIVLFVGMVFQPAFANDNNISVGKVEQQPRDGTFMKTFGGKFADMGYSVQQTTDGGYIITGFTWSYGDIEGDVLLIKTNKYGNKIWQRTFGEHGERDEGNCVQQTTDGGYIITGYTWTFDTENYDINILLIKTNKYGNKIWHKTFGGMYYDIGNCVQQTSDGGYIITARTDSYGAGSGDVWLIKTDNFGNMVWNRTFGGDKSDYGYSVQQTSDGGYIITGETHSYGAGKSNVWLIKTDSTGNKEWDKTFSWKDYDTSYCVQQTSDGGYIIAGRTSFFEIWETDVWLIKTDSTGNKEWDKFFGGIENDTVRCVWETNDGGYILTGWTDSFGDLDGDVWVIKTDTNGNKTWDRTFGGTGWDRGYCIQQTSDDGYIISGEKSIIAYSNCDVWLIKTDEFGRSKNKAVTGNMFFQGLLERFPLLQKLLLVME